MNELSVSCYQLELSISYYNFFFDFAGSPSVEECQGIMRDSVPKGQKLRNSLDLCAISLLFIDQRTI